MTTIKATHIKNTGTCPCCGHEDLDFSSVDYEGAAYLQEWGCPVCEAEGHDWYEPTTRHVTHPTMQEFAAQEKPQ